MNISLKTFGGLMPRIDATLLQDSSATVAHNCRLRSGKLTPMKKSASFMSYPVRLENGLADMKDAFSLFLWKRGWSKDLLAWPGHVTVAPSNLFADEKHRVFVAGETGIQGTQVEIPSSPVMTPDGLFMTSTFVQVFDGAPEYAGGICSTQSDPHRYLDGLSEYNNMNFVSVDSPPDETTHRTIYKVISVSDGTISAVTQASWSQAIDSGSFPIFNVVFDRSMDSSPVTLTFIDAEDPLNIPPEKDSGWSVTDPVPQDYMQSFFVQTYVDIYGRESAASPLSNSVTFKMDQNPAWETVAGEIQNVDSLIKYRRIYRVLGVYGDKLYAVTKPSWEDEVNAGTFDPLTISLTTTGDGDRTALYFSNRYVNQPCVYVSEVDNGAFDRHPICMDPLPKCGVTRASGGSTATNARYTVFFHSWVDEYGYESPVSDGTDEIVYLDGDTMNTGLVANAPVGAVKRRIYKVISGTETESIQFIYEQDAINGEFANVTFTVKDEDAGEIISPITQCPKDLCWIVNMPGNFYAGIRAFDRRQVCFSSESIPTSYPDSQRYDIREDSVALAVSGNTLFVLTVGQPYAISGTSPEAMTVSRIASNQACVSKYSVCTMNNAVFYASQDGVCMLAEGNQAETVITKGLFTRDQWNDLNPETCLMEAHDSALHMFFQKADCTRVAYMMDMIDGSPVLTTHSDAATAVYSDVESDALYLITEGGVQ